MSFSKLAGVVFAGALVVMAAVLVRQGSEMQELQSYVENLAVSGASVTSAASVHETSSTPPPSIQYMAYGGDLYAWKDGSKTLLIQDAPALKDLSSSVELSSFYVEDAFALLALTPSMGNQRPGGTVWKLNLGTLPLEIRDTKVLNRNWQILSNEKRALGYGDADGQGEVRRLYALDLLTQQERVFASLSSEQSFTAGLDEEKHPLFLGDWEPLYHFFGHTHAFPVYAAADALLACSPYTELCTYRVPVAVKIYSEGQ